MGKGTLLALGGGGLSAAAWFAAPVLGVPAGVLLIYFSPLPLLVLGLSLGGNAAAMGAAAGMVFMAVFAGVAAAAVFGATHALPAWLIVYQSLRRGTARSGSDAWNPVGHVLALLTVVVAAATAATAAAIGGGEGLEATVRALWSEAVEMWTPGLDETGRASLIEVLVPVFIGFSAGTLLVMNVVNGVIAQTLVARRHQAIRPTPVWSAFTLPDWIAWPLVGCAALGLLTSGDVAYLAVNLVIVFATPYFFLGLAVVHTAARGWGARTPILFLFYILLILFFLVLGGIVAALGMAEQWVGLRRHLVTRGPGPGPAEEE
jgi:hypothetical protein